MPAPTDDDIHGEGMDRHHGDRRKRTATGTMGRWRPRGVRLLVCATLTASSLAVVGHGAAAAPARAPALAPLLLARPNVPKGWHEVGAPKSDVPTQLGCLDPLTHPGTQWRRNEAFFANGKGMPFVSESLATGPHVTKAWQRLRTELSSCHSTTVTVDGTTERATITLRNFRTDATGALASRWRLTATGLALRIDLVVFRVHQTIGSVSYVDAGPGDALNAKGFADAAISKAGGGSGAVTGVVSVATAPVRVARTSDGTVAYRQVGSGPPLVLVMGFTGSMENWQPQFVNALAHRFRVVVFDNAGIGRTSALPAPLTIDAMAQQTSALIRALHLGAPDVLGWSMGGLIAQALAVRHPAQVHHLVLCATYPGTGAVQPSLSVFDGLRAGGTGMLSLLFPPGHEVAATVYAETISMYRSSTPAPAQVIAAQAAAILQAWAGNDAALARYRQIGAPTLVADGTRDRLVPAANPRALAAGIAGAKLIVYKGAGHAFLFQKLGAFVPAVRSFLSD